MIYRVTGVISTVHGGRCQMRKKTYTVSNATNTTSIQSTAAIYRDHDENQSLRGLDQSIQVTHRPPTKICSYTSSGLDERDFFEDLLSLAWREGDEGTGGSSEDDEEGCGMLPVSLLRLLDDPAVAAESRLVEKSI